LHLALSLSPAWNLDPQTYDGDTPAEARPDVRSRAQLLITNPDMLHTSILPAHSSFARLLGNLR
jgi:DEAD/DEAH box helicase domain-containing protein